METKEAWDSGRPIYSRLPEAYQELSPVADYLTQYWDEFLINTKSLVDDLPRQTDPLNCDPIWLDRLAPIYGFSGEYWDSNWSINSKRTLLANSYIKIWSKRGTKDSLSFVLTALNIEHIIWEGSNFILGTSQLSIGTLGFGGWIYKILLPRRYSINGYEFQLTRKINRLFGNVWCDSEVIYIDQLNN